VPALRRVALPLRRSGIDHRVGRMDSPVTLTCSVSGPVPLPADVPLIAWRLEWISIPSTRPTRRSVAGCKRCVAGASRARGTVVVRVGRCRRVCALAWCAATSPATWRIAGADAASDDCCRDAQRDPDVSGSCAAASVTDMLREAVAHRVGAEVPGVLPDGDRRMPGAAAAEDRGSAVKACFSPARSSCPLTNASWSSRSAWTHAEVAPTRIPANGVRLITTPGGIGPARPVVIDTGSGATSAVQRNPTKENDEDASKKLATVRNRLRERQSAHARRVRWNASSQATTRPQPGTSSTRSCPAHESSRRARSTGSSSSSRFASKTRRGLEVAALPAPPPFDPAGGAGPARRVRECLTSSTTRDHPCRVCRVFSTAPLTAGASLPRKHSSCTSTPTSTRWAEHEPCADAASRAGTPRT
jgi:hypothetical protein